MHLHALLAIGALAYFAHAQPFTGVNVSRFSEALSEPAQRHGDAYTGFVFDLNSATVHVADAPRDRIQK